MRGKSGNPRTHLASEQTGRNPLDTGALFLDPGIYESSIKLRYRPHPLSARQRISCHTLRIGGAELTGEYQILPEPRRFDAWEFIQELGPPRMVYLGPDPASRCLRRAHCCPDNRLSMSPLRTGLRYRGSRDGAKRCHAACEIFPLLLPPFRTTPPSTRARLLYHSAPTRISARASHRYDSRYPYRDPSG